MGLNSIPTPLEMVKPNNMSKRTIPMHYRPSLEDSNGLHSRLSLTPHRPTKNNVDSFNSINANPDSMLFNNRGTIDRQASEKGSPPPKDPRINIIVAPPPVSDNNSRPRTDGGHKV